MHALRILILTACLVGAVPAEAQQSPSVQRGQKFAQVNCARCHSINKSTPSPLAIAPPFRDLHRRYPVQTLEEP